MKKTVVYAVKKGDSLSKIAKEYGVSVSSIVAENAIKNANLIKVGQVLSITYTVPDPEPNYEKIGRAFVACLSGVTNSEAFKELENLLGE